MKKIELSDQSKAAADKLSGLYKEGKVFAKASPAVQRNYDVFVAASQLADEIGKDLGRFTNGEAAGHARYEILHNMKVIIRERVGPGRCAVGIYDFDDGACYYAGIVAC